MSERDPRPELKEDLEEARKSLLWKLEGLSEYDVRRPLVPTSTNLLGLVKHLAAWQGRRRRLEDVARGAGPAWAATPPASPPGTRSAVSGDCPPAPRRAPLASRT